jgi:hypothetical protein
VRGASLFGVWGIRSGVSSRLYWAASLLDSLDPIRWCFYAGGEYREWFASSSPMVADFVIYEHPHFPYENLPDENLLDESLLHEWALPWPSLDTP